MRDEDGWQHGLYVSFVAFAIKTRAEVFDIGIDVQLTTAVLAGPRVSQEGASMRAVLAMAMLASLAACDDAGQAAAPEPAREITAEIVEAERACGELTGYVAGGQADKAADTWALLQKEFNACVAAVTGGDKPELRGRTESRAGEAAQPSP
jgi:hypothetical protein